MPAAADQASAATAPYTTQPENRPAAPQYTQQPEARPAQASAPQQPEYNNLNQQPPPPAATAAAAAVAATAAAARPSNYAEYLARQSQYPPPPNTQPGGPPTMAQATSSSPAPIDGKNRNQSNMKSDAVVPIDPSIAASSPTYPPPYSPYQPQPQGHDMTQYQGHPPPQMYARPEWAHGYPPPHHQHGMPGPYSAPATTVGTAAPTTTGPRPGQVRYTTFFFFLVLRVAFARVGCVLLADRISELTRCFRSTRSFRFPVHSNISALAVVTKKLSVCTSVAGTGVRKRMAL